MQTAKIINLNQPTSEQKRNEEVINKLHEMLILAELGEITGFVGSTLRKDGTVNYGLYGSCADRPTVALTMVTRLISKLSRQIMPD